MTRRRRITVIDDEPNIGLSLRLVLEGDGHVVTVCDCAACRFAGGDRVLRELEEELGIRAGETSADGSVSLETRPDVGSGAISPAVRVDTLVYGPLDAEKALHIVRERLAADRGVAAGAS